MDNTALAAAAAAALLDPHDAELWYLTQHGDDGIKTTTASWAAREALGGRSSQAYHGGVENVVVERPRGWEDWNSLPGEAASCHGELTASMLTLRSQALVHIVSLSMSRDRKEAMERIAEVARRALGWPYGQVCEAAVPPSSLTCAYERARACSDER